MPKVDQNKPKVDGAASMELLSERTSLLDELR